MTKLASGMAFPSGGVIASTKWPRTSPLSGRAMSVSVSSLRRAPFLQEIVPAARVARIQDLELRDAIGTEMTHRVAQLAEGDQHLHAVEEAKRERPHSASGRARLLVFVPEVKLVLGADCLAQQREIRIGCD